MRKVSLVLGVLFLAIAFLSAVSGQVIPVMFNVIGSIIWVKLYLKLSAQ